MATDDRVRIAAVSDLHYTKGCKGICQEIFMQESEQADVLLLCGDLTDYGLPEEAQVLADDLHSHARIPVIAVWGNHDFESARMAQPLKLKVSDLPGFVDVVAGSDNR
jgi:predicted MPP superfamily phosphohydrolase